MKKYIKHTNVDGIVVYEAKGENIFIPPDELNRHYIQLQQEVADGEAVIEELEPETRHGGG